jgi:hypothetical protein
MSALCVTHLTAFLSLPTALQTGAQEAAGGEGQGEGGAEQGGAREAAEGRGAEAGVALAEERGEVGGAQAPTMHISDGLLAAEYSAWLGYQALQSGRTHGTSWPASALSTHQQSVAVCRGSCVLVLHSTLAYVV